MSSCTALAGCPYSYWTWPVLTLSWSEGLDQTPAAAAATSTALRFMAHASLRATQRTSRPRRDTAQTIPPRTDNVQCRRGPKTERNYRRSLFHFDRPTHHSNVAAWPRR